MEQVEIIVARHPDGFIAYPLGLRGAVAGQGETAEEAVADARSAIRFHVETFGATVLDGEASTIDPMTAPDPPTH